VTFVEGTGRLLEVVSVMAMLRQRSSGPSFSMADNAYKRGVRVPDGNARPASHLRCPVLIPMMVVPPDLPQVEGGAAAKVDGRVLLAHAPMVIVREGLVGTAIIAHSV